MQGSWGRIVLGLSVGVFLASKFLANETNAERLVNLAIAGMCVGGAMMAARVRSQGGNAEVTVLLIPMLVLTRLLTILERPTGPATAALGVALLLGLAWVFARLWRALSNPSAVRLPK